MKLYGTTTSERASKGQGGNKYLNIEATVGENKTVVVDIAINHEETYTEDIYKIYHSGILMDTIRETKGKKQKDETNDDMSVDDALALGGL